MNGRNDAGDVHDCDRFPLQRGSGNIAAGHV
jgi:hypothetical protein